MKTFKTVGLVSILLVFSMALVFAAGEQEEAAGTKAVTLTLMSRSPTPGPDAEVDADLRAFEQMMAEKGYDITVEITRFGGTDSEYATKKTLLFRSGKAADVVFVEIGRGQNYMRAGFLQELDQYVENWEPWDDVYGPIKNRMQYNGHAYMVPIRTACTPLYYRKDLFEKAGMDREWNPKSWADITAAAQKIKAALPDVTPILFIGGKEAGVQVAFTRFNLLIHGAGGTMYDEEQEKWIVASQPLLDTLSYYEELTKKGLLGPSSAVSASADEWAYRTFSEGKGAIHLYGPWAYTRFWGEGKNYEIPNLEEVVGYVKMPAMAPGKSLRGQDFVTQSGGWNYTISKDCKNPDLAWELIEYLSQPEIQAKYNAGTGHVATRSDVIEQPIYQEKEFLAEISKWLPYTYLSPSIFPGWAGGPRQKISDAIGNIMLGNMTAMEGMKYYADEMEKTVGLDKVIYQYDF